MPAWIERVLDMSALFLREEGLNIDDVVRECVRALSWSWMALDWYAREACASAVG